MKLGFFRFGQKKLKVGLALGGGATRGFAHIGVIKALNEHGIDIDFVSGTSAGSIVGAMYAAGISTDTMIQSAKALTVKDIRTSKIPLVPNKTEGLEEILDNLLKHADYKNLIKPFCAVATDVKTGNEIHITKGNVAKSVVASCAVPGFFNPVPIGDYLFFDGGLVNNIPANVPKLFGCNVVIAVDINSTRGQGTASTKFVDLMMASIRIMMKSNSLNGYINADVMIQPDLKRFSATKLVGIDEMIEEGYKATIFKMDEIKQLLGIKTNVKKLNRITNKINSKNKMIV